MTKLEINTDQINSAANKLRASNNNINNAFRTLQSQLRQLEANWKGAAGTAAQTTMYQLFNHNEARTTVLQNYLSILERQVNPGYQEAETSNTRLADKFR